MTRPARHAAARTHSHAHAPAGLAAGRARDRSNGMQLQAHLHLYSRHDQPLEARPQPACTAPRLCSACKGPTWAREQATEYPTPHTRGKLHRPAMLPPEAPLQQVPCLPRARARVTVRFQGGAVNAQAWYMPTHLQRLVEVACIVHKRAGFSLCAQRRPSVPGPHGAGRP